MDDEAVGKLTPGHEKPGESHTPSPTAQAEHQGHEVVPDPGGTGPIMQMDTDACVSGTVEKASVGHEVGPEMCTAEITPNLNEVMETYMSNQDRDQHPETSTGTPEKDSAGHETVPDSRAAEIIPKQNEEMETSVSEQTRDQHSDTEKRTFEADTVSPLLGGGGSLALLSMQYRDGSSDDLSER